MTVGQLKEFLKDVPDEAIAYFTIWRSDGEHNYWFNPHCGKILSNNGKYARIIFVDDCLMYRLETLKEEVTNSYECPRCAETWEEEGEREEKSKCPSCGRKNVAPK